MQMFNFDYAGKANIFIHYTKPYYIVTASGIHFVDDIYTFSPNYKRHWKFKKLYNAIYCFNQLVSFTCSSMDWFNPEVFETSKVYEELFIK